MEPSVSPACAQCGAPFTPHVAGQTLCDRCQGLATPEPPKSPLEHAQVAGFTLAHEIGAGRFSTSWLAEDPQGRACVLKLLRRYAPDPNTVQRFLAEAQRIAGAPELQHPNIARLLSGGVHLVQAFFLVYEAGGESTLADELRARGRVVPPRALELCAQLAEGLAVMHRAGIAHLDLKPANVGLTKSADGMERAILLDFATSHLLSRAHIRETDPLPLSTAAYLAPELARDGRSDVYALGALLFQLVSGRLPMMGATADELIVAHREHPPLRLRDVGRRVSDELEDLVARLLAKEPAKRPSIDEVAVLMRAIIPVADTAPMEDAAESVEDPVPVVQAPRPEPQLMPAPPRVDPGLERAMLGHVPPQPPEKAPGVPSWMPYIWPRWTMPAALAGAVLVVILFVALWPREKPAAPARAPKTALTTAAPKPVPAPAPAPAPAKPPPAPVPARDQNSVQNFVQPPPPPKKSPYAKDFERAQKALWTGKTASAESILQGLLKKRLTAPDRARAMKLMGDASAKRGNKPAAVVWYRKAIQADPSEREKIERALQAVR